MVTFRQVAPGTFEEVSGNPMVLSLDGRERAPLLSVLALSAARQRAFGIHQSEPDPIPEGKEITGKRVEVVSGRPRLVYETRDIPLAELDSRTPVEKLTEAVGMSIEDIRAALGLPEDPQR